MAWNGQTVWLLLWLGVWTISDFRRRSICLWQVLLVLAGGFLWQLPGGRLWTWDTAGGLMLGGLSWVFGRITAGQFGTGDALVILCLGLYVGFSGCLAVLFLALLLASLAALVLLLLKKSTLQSEIPFIPFLAAGFAAMLIVR